MSRDLINWRGSALLSRTFSNTEDLEVLVITRRDDKNCVLGHLPRYFCKWVSHFSKKSTNKAMAEIVRTKVLIVVLVWVWKYLLYVQVLCR